MFFKFPIVVVVSFDMVPREKRLEQGVGIHAMHTASFSYHEFLLEDYFYESANQAATIL